MQRYILDGKQIAKSLFPSPVKDDDKIQVGATVYIVEKIIGEEVHLKKDSPN